MAFVNKMDVIGADYYGCVDQIKNRLGKNPIMINIPIGKEDTFIGLIDLFDMEAYYYKNDVGTDIEITPIPDDLMDEAQMYHDQMVEQICSLDDDLMEQYLEGEEPSVDALRKVLR